MRYRHDYTRSSPAMGFNATPMVDVFFMLTIFFMLVTRFSSAEQIPMQVPKPQQSQAHVTKMDTRVVINCRLANPTSPSTSAVKYSIGPNRPESLAVISDRLAVMKAERPEIKVVVRADRRLPYIQVRRLMQTIAENGIEMLNVVAHVGEDQ